MLRRLSLLFLLLVLGARVVAAEPDTVLLTKVHDARSLECGERLVIFDKGGKDAVGDYSSNATCWYYMKTMGKSPIRVHVEATLTGTSSVGSSLAFYKKYPSNSEATSPDFTTTINGQYTIAYFRGQTGGLTVDSTFVCSTGELSLRFLSGGSSYGRNANFKITIFVSDTSEVYNIIQSDITSSSARLSWQDSSAATSWTVKYGTDEIDLGNEMVVQSPTATLTGLTSNTPYYVRIYNNARTTEALSGYCTRNEGYFVTLGADGGDAIPTGCIGDFSDLSASHVICTYGHYDNPAEHIGAQNGRHTVMTNTAGHDPIIGDSLSLIPEGADVSIRLGNSNTNNEAESIVYRFRVDAAQNDILLLKYAAVMQDPSGHTSDIQPRFSLQILRENGLELEDECYRSEFIGSSVHMEGERWHNHGRSSQAAIMWCEWSSVGVDLTPFDGEIIYVKLTTRDCNHSAATHGGNHYAYAYLTLQCAKKQIAYQGCESESSTLVAPDGFVYDWHELGSTTTVSTEREFTPPAGTGAIYECTMTFRGSSNRACSFSMLANPDELQRYPHANFTAPVEVDAGATVNFTNTSFLSRDAAGEDVLPNAEMQSYQWYFGDGATSDEKNPSHTFPVSPRDRIYTVSLTAASSNACQDEYHISILVHGTGEPEPVDENCVVPYTADDWANPTREWTSAEQLSTHTIPLVGDLNGDGHPNIVCLGYSSAYTKTLNTSTGYRVNSLLAIYDGVTHERLTLTEPQMKNHDGQIVWADEFSVAPYGILRAKYLNTNIDTGLIVVATTRVGSSPAYYTGSSNNYFLQAYDIHGVNIWTSSAPYGTDRSDRRREYPATVSFADFNGDGYPEVYVRNKVFNAATGELLLEVESENNNEGDSWAHKCGGTNYYGILSAPFAADLDGDGLPELILGNEAYSIRINNRNGATGNSAELMASHTPPTNDHYNVPNDGHTQVADFNGDGFLDVLVSVRTTTDNGSYTFYYVWDVHNGTVGDAFRVATTSPGKSIPLIADIDNDGALEVVLQAPSNGQRIKALRYDSQTAAFTQIWNQSYNEDSWSNTMTMFDFNGDGENELLMSLRDSWKVLKAATGTEIATLPHGEVTIMDYPVIADVDNDGSAEILTIDGNSSSPTANGFLHVWGSGGIPWKAARPVWNQYMYNVTCVNDDLTIPSLPINNAVVMTDPEGTERRPYNHFFQQEGTLDRYGRPAQYAADLMVEIPNGVSQDDDWVRLPLHLCNQGLAVMQSPIGITVYSDIYRGTAVDTFYLHQTLAVGECVDTTVTLPMGRLCELETSQLLVAANDNGGGVAQNGNPGQQAECDTVNNLLLARFHACVRNIIQAEEHCVTYTWPLNGVTYTESTNEPFVTIPGVDGDPDTVVTLHLTILEPGRGDTIAGACHEYSWYEHTAMTPPQEVTHVFANAAVNGCDSIVTLHLSLLLPGFGDTIAETCHEYSWYEHTAMTPPQEVTHVFADAAANGCDSIVTLHLSVSQSALGDTTAVVCGSFDWYEHRGMTTSQNVVHTFEQATIDGCDSIVTLYLTVHQASSGDTVADVCDPFDWYEYTNITTSREVSHIFVGGNVHGCDSTVTLHLTRHYHHRDEFYDTICFGEIYSLGELQCTEAGTYTVQMLTPYGCDSSETVHLFVKPALAVEIVPEYDCVRESCWLTAVTNGEYYTWSVTPDESQLNGHEHDEGVMVVPHDTMLVELMVDYATGHSCPATALTEIYPVHRVIAEIEHSPERLTPDNLLLTAVDRSSGNVSRTWFVDGMFMGSEPNIEYRASRYDDSVVLLMEAYNDLCRETVERVVRIVDETLYVPNVFTPALSTNSVFRAYGRGILDFRMTVFNREGLQVFTSENIEDGWDGTRQGEECPVASYVYRIQYRGELEPEFWHEVTGSVLLMR